MSDSEEDFASADEGEIEPNPASLTKGVSKETDAHLEGSKVAEKPDNVAVTSDASSVESASKHGSAESKVTEKGAKSVTASAESGKKEKQGKDADDVQKYQSGNGKKKNRKGKKGKGGQGENIPSGKKLAEKSDTKETESTETKGDKSLTCGEHEEMIQKKEPESENSNDLNQGDTGEKDVMQSDSNKVDTSLSDVDSNEKVAPAEKVKEDSVSDTPGSLSIAEKAELLKSPSSQSILRVDPDNSEEKVDEDHHEPSGSEKQTKSGWSWGWGSSLLEVASSSVSTFTHQVGEGLHTMMETVESTLNVPNPEELAQKVEKEKNTTAQEASESVKDDEPAEDNNSNKDVKIDAQNQPVSTSDSPDVKPSQSTKDEKTDDQSGDGWFSAWGVSNISKIVENTGKSLVTGSLDVLETLGKKTFDVINEQDPGLKTARSFLNDSRNKPNLSAMLRDAKEQHEAEAEHKRESEEARKAHFGSLFDDFNGLAHLEALEMLSNQSEKRVNVHLNALSSDSLAELKPDLLQIKQMFEVDELEENDTNDDFTFMIKDLFQKLNVKITPDKLLQTCDRIGEEIVKCNDTETATDVKEINRLAISSLAEFTSKCIEHFHKIGELILIQKSLDVNFVDTSKTLLGISQVMAAKIGMISNKFTECLNKQETDDEREINQFVTNIFLEANNSTSYIQDGFQLLLPVIQQAAIETSQAPES